MLPLATPGEVLGTLTIVSFDPARPLETDDVDVALAVAAQAALAIDNARLYQQQKDFAETMQRSLLPRALPRVSGLDVGHVYQSSARVDVGGDLYDFVELEDGRLAVAVGDVLGKGISAAADMAMTKFSFRVLARGDAEPSAVLASANDVVYEDIEPGKFVTLLYAVVDPVARQLAYGSAGHPPARIVEPSGRVKSLGVSGPSARDRARPGVPVGAHRARARLGRRPLHGRRARGTARRRALRRGAARPPAVRAPRPPGAGARVGDPRRLPTSRGRRPLGRLRHRLPQAGTLTT